MNPLRRLATAAAVFSTLALGVLAADEPVPLLKPVTPTGNTVRVRFPVDGKSNLTASQFKAQVPAGRGKSKKAEMIDVTVSFDTLPAKSYVSVKKWQSWGYEVPANKVGLLPELVIPGSQLAPKASKRDVLVRIPSVSLEIIDPPGGGDTVFGSDLAVSIRELTKNNDRVMEPRYYFTPQFLELSVLGTNLRRPGTDDGTPPEPTLTKEPAGLVPVSGPTVARGVPVFAYAAVNGISQYKTPDGRDEWVNVGVASYSNWKGLFMTLGTARGCGVEMESATDLTGIGTTFEAMIGKGRLKEFRLGLLTGPGLKTPKDLVLHDVPVFIDKNNSEHFVWLGPELINEYLKDAVYAFGPDGWRLYGRTKAEYLKDITTRTPPKKQ